MAGRSISAREDEVKLLLAAAITWASAQGDIQALALVGSHARGEATADSDVDLIVLTDSVERYTGGDNWLAAFGASRVIAKRSWGAITERRVLLPSGLEIEVGFGRPCWASLSPLDPGTRGVVAGGTRVLYDPRGILAALVHQVAVADGAEHDSQADVGGRGATVATPFPTPRGT